MTPNYGDSVRRIAEHRESVLADLALLKAKGARAILEHIRLTDNRAEMPAEIIAKLEEIAGADQT